MKHVISFAIMFAFTLFFVAFNYTTWNHDRLKNPPEYSLDLINQDTVLIRNVETGREYTVRPERIVETLENDNL